MNLISINTVETDEGTRYTVELYEATANVRVHKHSRFGSPFKQRVKFGGASFKQAIKALVQRAEPGSLMWEELNRCDCDFVREALGRAA